MTIGDGTELVSTVTILSSTSLSKNCKVYPFAVLGGPPQDKKYSGENTALIIGNNTIIREFVSINTGTADGGGITRVGNRCYIMTNVHVGHDCQVDDDVVLATGAGLAGHVSVGRGAVISGQVGIHQFLSDRPAGICWRRKYSHQGCFAFFYRYRKQSNDSGLE